MNFQHWPSADSTTYLVYAHFNFRFNEHLSFTIQLKREWSKGECVFKASLIHNSRNVWAKWQQISSRLSPLFLRFRKSKYSFVYINKSQEFSLFAEESYLYVTISWTVGLFDANLKHIVAFFHCNRILWVVHPGMANPSSQQGSGFLCYFFGDLQSLAV